MVDASRARRHRSCRYLRENLAANEGARSFTYETTRNRTPLGHVHREQIRDLTIAEIREMNRQTVDRLLNEVSVSNCSYISIRFIDCVAGHRSSLVGEISVCVRLLNHF